MPRRAALPFGPLAVIYSLLFAAPSYAQFPQIPKRCSPPFKLLPLTRTVADQSAQNPDADAPHRKVIIERIDFDGPIHLPDSVVAQIIADANANDHDWWNADDGGWLNGFTEIGLRGAWQNQGYFRVKVSAEAKSVGGDSNQERFQVTAHVDEGLQYHLGELRFADALGGVRGSGTRFSESQLRAAFPLREGDLFNVDLIRKGIEQLTKLYVSQGYADFTAVPETEVNDQLQRISLVMQLDEEKQFHVGNFEILGLDPSLEAGLRSIIRPGEIYNPQPAYDFLKENQPLLPPDVSSDDLQSRRRATGIVDLVFDGLPCPPLNSR
jgi:surface antigen-like variable number repeat protein